MEDWQHGFYKLKRAKRQQLIAQQFDLSKKQEELLDTQQDPINEQMVENYLTSFHLPQGLAVNLVVDHQSYVVPMVTEEPSVIAAASNGAKLVAANGGFKVSQARAMRTGQIVLTGISDFNKTSEWLTQRENQILSIANQAKPSMQRHGGGATKVTMRLLKNGWLSVDLLIDTAAAMGANTINTMCEAVGEWLTTQHFHVLTAILSNLATDSLQTASCTIDVADLASTTSSGPEVAQKIAQLSDLAQLDPYRATTHNKGIMNGIDAVLIATGNDWRAIESGAHAYAASDGDYKGLSTWSVAGTKLIGSLTLPLPVGIVGGSIDIVGLVQLNQQIMKIKSAQQLAQIIASIGLAQNLAAMKALATDGIQAGHMQLQYRALALSIGATTAEIETLIAKLNQLPHVDRQSARTALKQLRKESPHGKN